MLALTRCQRTGGRQAGPVGLTGGQGSLSRDLALIVFGDTGLVAICAVMFVTGINVGGLRARKCKRLFALISNSTNRRSCIFTAEHPQGRDYAFGRVVAS